MAICANETCRLPFTRKETTQLYCCVPCGKTQASRRKNRRRNGDLLEIAAKNLRDMEFHANKRSK